MRNFIGDDTQEILDRLNSDVESILNKFWSGWIKQGKKALATPRQGPNKRVTSSFIVELDGSNRGRWYRHSKGVGGWGLHLLYYGETGERGIPQSDDEKAEAFRFAREFLGMPQQQAPETPEQRAARDADRAKAKAEREAQQHLNEQTKLKTDIKRMLSAKDVWDQTVPLAGTHGEAYLVARGIPPIAEWPWDPHDTLRFHPALDFEPDRDAGRFPAIICKVVDVFDGFLAVWQIFLERDRPVKADLMPSPKIGRGPASGGAVRIGGEAEWIDVCEGVETALGAWFLGSNRRPCWSLLSTSGMKNFEPPLNVKRINVWKDGDKAVLHRQTGAIMAPPGQGAAEALLLRMKPAGIRIAVNDMTRDGDALDLWNAMQRFERRAS